MPKFGASNQDRRLFVQPTQPTSGETQAGNVWADSDDGEFYIATSSSTFVLVGPGGGSTHSLDSSTHTDVPAITEAKGQILVQNGGTWLPLTVGANDEVLTADSAEALGMKWAAGGGGNHTFDAAAHTDVASMTEARGDIIRRTSGGSWDKLAIGGSDAVLQSDGNDPLWGTLNHSQLGGTGTDDHHSESHTVVSHSDTAATGAQLNSMVQGGTVDDLHVHNHGSLVNVTSDQHHARSHDHSDSNDGDALAPATFTFPAAAAPAPSTEGQAIWDSNGDYLVIGTAGGSVLLLPVNDATSDPADISTSASDGSEDTAARKDHVHNHPAGLGVDLHHNESHVLDGGTHTISGQTDGNVLKATGATTFAFEADLAGVNFIIDGGGSAITSGEKGHVELPFAGTITSARALADQSGSVTVAIWKDTYANFPPTGADDISNGGITISGSAKAEDTSLSGWTTTFAKGDILAYNVAANAATIQRVTISLSINKT